MTDGEGDGVDGVSLMVLYLVGGGRFYLFVDRQLVLQASSAVRNNFEST